MGNNEKIVFFLNKDGSVFAKSPVANDAALNESFISCKEEPEKYFIRLVHENGINAWVGMKFKFSLDAKEFEVCFTDFKKKFLSNITQSTESIMKTF